MKQPFTEVTLKTITVVWRGSVVICRRRGSSLAGLLPQLLLITVVGNRLSGLPAVSSETGAQEWDACRNYVVFIPFIGWACFVCLFCYMFVLLKHTIKPVCFSYLWTVWFVGRGASGPVTGSYLANSFTKIFDWSMFWSKFLNIVKKQIAMLGTSGSKLVKKK